MHEFLSASSIIHDHEWTRLLGERLTCNLKRKRLLSWENLQLLLSRKALLLTCELFGAQPHVPMYKGTKEGMSSRTMNLTVSCERNEALFEQRLVPSHLQNTLSRQSSQAITFIWMASAVVPPLLEKKGVRLWWSRVYNMQLTVSWFNIRSHAPTCPDLFSGFYQQGFMGFPFFFIPCSLKWFLLYKLLNILRTSILKCFFSYILLPHLAIFYFLLDHSVFMDHIRRRGNR